MKKQMFTLLLAAFIAISTGSLAELIREPDELPTAPSELAEAEANHNWDSIFIPLVDEAAATAIGNRIPGMYIGMLPIQCEVTADGDAAIVFGDIYAASGRIDTLSATEYASITWINVFAAATLHRDEGALQGWTLDSFNLEAESELIDEAQAYLDSMMKLYTDQEAGFSVLYPNVFQELKTGEDKDGCTGVVSQTSDKKATFSAGCRSNDDRLTIDKIIAERKKSHPDLIITSSSLTSVTRLTWVEGSNITSECWIITQPSVYHTVMTWDESLLQDFALYSEYLMNSFAADELGIG